MILNRPFLYGIVSDGVLLFAGVCNQPAKVSRVLWAKTPAVRLYSARGWRFIFFCVHKIARMLPLENSRRIHEKQVE